MKNISIFFSALLFSVAETNAQITPPYYNPANVNITGGNINGSTIGATTPSTGAFTTVTQGSGVTGIVLRDYTSGGASAIYNGSVTPDATNFAVATTGSVTTLNAVTTLGFQIGGTGSNKLSLSSTLTTSVNPFSVTDATDSTSTTTGALKTAGGLGVAKKSFFGDALQVGSGSGTSAGLIVGYLGVSGFGAIWSSGVTPSTNNYGFATTGAGDTYLRGASTARLNVNSVDMLVANATGLVHAGNMTYDKTVTAAGTTGARTINKTTGRVNFAAAATSLVVTNSLATANSICHVTKATNDATMRLGACVAAAGSITIYADVAPTAETAVNFTVTN